MRRHQGYLGATRHPWPCFLFVLPLLAAYELGVLWLGGTQPDTLRNGADAWLRWGLESFGLTQLYGAPALVAAVLLVWSWWRFTDRPSDLLGVLIGMSLECVAFALALWGLSRAIDPLLHQLDIWAGCSLRTEDVGRMVTFLGAGIYEEMLFRLALFSGLVWLLDHLQFPGSLALLLGALASSALFAAAHHIGPYGEPMHASIFFFRLAAGLYFAALYRLRGFGIAAGAHACYDVLVGIVVE